LIQELDDRALTVTRLGRRELERRFGLMLAESPPNTLRPRQLVWFGITNSRSAVKRWLKATFAGLSRRPPARRFARGNKVKWIQDIL